jgi:hypothetical protein
VSGATTYVSLIDLHPPRRLIDPLTINKPLECRSAVLLLPFFRPMPEGYILLLSFYAASESRGGLEEGMDTLASVRPKDDLLDEQPNQNSFLGEDSLRMPAELWAPPLAPFGDQEAFLAPGSRRRTLIAGIAIGAAFGVAALTYFFLGSPGAEAPAETSTASSPTGVEASFESQLQATIAAEPSPGASGVIPLSRVAASRIVAASPQVAANALTTLNSTPQNPDDRVFLQRAGVNIRSGPSGTASVVGTAPKGTQFTATGREGDWVQVENTRFKGWINSHFLTPDKPQ